MSDSGGSSGGRRLNRARMKVREMLRKLYQDSWYLARTRGSHRQLKNPRKSGLVTVAGKDGDDIPIRTERSILKQARLSR
jgi:predicted RNA binding protein YcfA (HicA-like mRNA interferase family)